MEATFFRARHDEAVGVTSRDDLGVEEIAEPLRLESIAWLRRLPGLVGARDGAFAAPLRDATCRSFPVWQLPADLASAIAALDEDGIDRVAMAWHDAEAADADPHELACLLGGLRDALHEATGDESLYVLLEEKAL